MRTGDRPAKARLTTSAVLLVLAGSTLTIGAAGTASAAEATAAEVVLSSQQAGEVTRLVAAEAARPMVHPSCIDGACGVELSPSQTQALWKAVVNQPIQTARKYCEGLFNGALKPYCGAAAQYLSNLTAPNGRCLFVGLAPATNGSKLVIKYTTAFCW